MVKGMWKASVECHLLARRGRSTSTRRSRPPSYQCAARLDSVLPRWSRPSGGHPQGVRGPRLDLPAHRHRRLRARPARDDRAVVRVSAHIRRGEPSDREEPPWLPIGYAVLLVAIVAVLFVTLTFNAQDKISAKVTHPGLQVNVRAAKWNWRFDYPAQHISQIGGDSTPTSLVVPSGTDVRFNLTSLDVIHSFWIPYVRFKRDLPAAHDLVRALVPRRRLPHRGSLRRVCRAQARPDDLHGQGDVAQRLQRVGRPAAASAGGESSMSTATTTLPRARGGVLGLMAGTDHKHRHPHLPDWLLLLRGRRDPRAAHPYRALLRRASDFVNQDHYNEIFSMHRLDDDLPLRRADLAGPGGLLRAPPGRRRGDRPAPPGPAGLVAASAAATTMSLQLTARNETGDAGWTAYDPLSDATNTPVTACTCGSSA